MFHDGWSRWMMAKFIQKWSNMCCLIKISNQLQPFKGLGTFRQKRTFARVGRFTNPPGSWPRAIVSTLWVAYTIRIIQNLGTSMNYVTLGPRAKSHNVDDYCTTRLHSISGQFLPHVVGHAQKHGTVENGGRVRFQCDRYSWSFPWVSFMECRYWEAVHMNHHETTRHPWELNNLQASKSQTHQTHLKLIQLAWYLTNLDHICGFTHLRP